MQSAAATVPAHRSEARKDLVAHLLHTSIIIQYFLTLEPIARIPLPYIQMESEPVKLTSLRVWLLSWRSRGRRPVVPRRGARLGRRIW